jgi:hypothetical protein
MPSVWRILSGDVCITKVRALMASESSGGFESSIGKTMLGYLI